MARELQPHECRLLAEFLGILSHPTRLQMICALRKGPKTVSELARYAGVSMSNASQHLRTMRYKELVRTDREGQHIYYAIVDPRFLDGVLTIWDALVDMARRQADSATDPSAGPLSEVAPETISVSEHPKK